VKIRFVMSFKAAGTFREIAMRRVNGDASAGLVLFIGLVVIAIISVIVWLGGSDNVATPAGYVGYVTQGSILGSSHFMGTQTGPCSTGREWLVACTNVSVTPYSYDELFKADDGTAVLSHDKMRISFGVHVVFRIDPEKVQDFMEHYSTLQGNDTSNKIVEDAYNNFVAQRLRTFARMGIEKYDWQDLQDAGNAIQTDMFNQVKGLCENTPFDVISVVVGNMQYPQTVADSVAEAQAATQILQRKQNEIKQSQADAQKRIEDAKGIAAAMDIVNQKLTPAYLQYMAIQAQSEQVNGQNHTVIYIPTGNLGVPLTGTFNVASPAEDHTSAK
jgi:regulator of protease activity HflC (stomatin/prohibitin superfamily)